MKCVPGVLSDGELCHVRDVAEDSLGTTPGLDLRHASSDGEFYAGNV